MSKLPPFHGDYATPSATEASWERLGARVGASSRVVGATVQGRPIRAHSFGDGAVDVLLSAAMHGVEVVGAVALESLVARLADGSVEARRLLRRARFHVVPVVNPDAFSATLDAAASGRRAGQRGNARRVDLNRNFPAVPGRSSWHPFSGSRFAFSPHYAGPRALSEPESHALATLAADVRPAVSLAFHSFGEMLLYPFACSFERHPRAGEYEALGAAMNAAMPGRRYQVKPSAQLYPVIGDFDDWLDAQFSTLAMTVEVGALDRRLLHPMRLFNPFSWMNPVRVAETVAPLTSGMFALLERALGVSAARSLHVVPRQPRRTPLDIAAKKLVVRFGAGAPKLGVKAVRTCSAAEGAKPPETRSYCPSGAVALRSLLTSAHIVGLVCVRARDDVTKPRRVRYDWG